VFLFGLKGLVYLGKIVFGFCFVGEEGGYEGVVGGVRLILLGEEMSVGSFNYENTL